MPILMYHRLTIRPDPHPCNMVAGRFRTQLKILRALGYRTVSPRDIARALRSGSPLPARAISITFDDGYVDTFTVALPILKEFGFTAVCYVVADRVGQFSDWTTAASLMGWPEICEWMAAGMEVGSHSRTHRDLTLLPTVELQNEVAGSRKLLEDRLGCAVPTFAYPFTVQGPRERDAVEAAGYEAACAGVQPHDSIFALARAEAAPNSLSWFLAQLLPVYPELHQRYVLARRRARAWFVS
jgi:peptidoglycan/xylan/chitin deacetylase (PgdA/CDA1 family)